MLKKGRNFGGRLNISSTSGMAERKEQMVSCVRVMSCSCGNLSDEKSYSTTHDPIKRLISGIFLINYLYVKNDPIYLEHVLVPMCLKLAK